KAREYLERAGYRRPENIVSESAFGSLRNVFRGLIFTRTDTDDILVNDRGEKASFSLIYGSPGLTRHLTVMQQEYRRAGIDMRLQFLEPGTAFERGLERKYEMTLTGRTTDLYPDPRQFFHSEFTKSTNNNNIWSFGTPEVDELISVYEESQDHATRLKAMYRIDEIVHDEAFYIPFWGAPYIRLVHWDYLVFPDFYLPRRLLRGFGEWPVFWFDPERKAALDQAMATGQALPVDEDIDKDFYGVRERFE
ncbi:MAG: hypothetical protein AB7F99_14075, partial [Vicinamibacterales bacterium]